MFELLFGIFWGVYGKMSIVSIEFFKVLGWKLKFCVLCVLCDIFFYVRVLFMFVF